MKYLLIYLLAINIIGFTIMGIDKSKAKKINGELVKKQFL